MPLAYHYDSIYNDLRDSVEKFSWNSHQTKVAVKTALSCTTAIFMANVLKLDMPFWAGITTLVIMRPNVGASFSKGWMRTGGCTIGCILAFFFVGYVVQNPLLFSAFLFTGIILAFYSGVRAKNGYFWSYMLSNMVLIAMISIYDPYDTFPLHIAFYRASEIFLGVLVSWIYNIVLWPSYASNEIEDSLNSLLSGTILLQRDLILFYTGKKNDFNKIKKEYDSLNKLLNKCKAIIYNVETENWLLRNDRAEYPGILELIDSILLSTSNRLRSLSGLGEAAYPQIYNALFDETVANLERLAEVENFTDGNFKELLLDRDFFITDISRLHDPDVSRNYPLPEVLFFYEFVYHFQFLYADLRQLSKNAQNSSDHPSLLKPSKRDSEDYVNLNICSFSLSLHVPSLMNAAKGGIAILITFWFCLWLRIPDAYLNMTVAIIAVFGPQLDTLASKHKGLLRVTGCLLGAAVGLFILQFDIESATIYFFIIFCITSVSSYIYGARPGVAYIGLQAGIAFLICFAGDFHPATSIDSVIERLTGIFFAITFMWIVNALVWPEDLIAGLNTKLNSFKEYLIDYASNALKNRSFALSINAADIHSTLKILEIQQDLSFREIAEVAKWTTLIKNISDNLSSLDRLSSETVDVVTDLYPSLLEDISSDLISVLSADSEKAEIMTLKSLDERFQSIERLMSEIRNKEVMKGRTIELKMQTAYFLLTIQRIVDQLKRLGQIHLNKDLQPHSDVLAQSVPNHHL